MNSITTYLILALKMIYQMRTFSAKIQLQNMPKPADCTDDTVGFTGGSILGYPADAGIAAGDYRAQQFQTFLLKDMRPL